MFRDKVGKKIEEKYTVEVMNLLLASIFVMERANIKFSGTIMISYLIAHATYLRSFGSPFFYVTTANISCPRSSWYWHALFSSINVTSFA